MKRSFVLVLIGMVALAVGCAKQEPAPPAPPTDASAAAAAPAAPADAAAPAATPAAAAAPAPPGAPAASKPAPPPPPESVKDLPDYPGAVRTAFSEKTAGKDYAHTTEAEWTSADAYAKVVEYYQKTVVEKGWTIAETKTKKAGIEWRLTKGTSIGTVEVRDAAPVTVKVERKDR
jgi:hypothetical protein